MAERNPQRSAIAWKRQLMLLDSNIIIYCIQPQFQSLREWVQSNRVSVSAITLVEVLGYHQLTKVDKQDFEELFNCTETYSVSHEVVDLAICLRQQRKMSLGDAIIAATSLVYQKTLVTRNIKDFEWVEGLKLFNPLG